MWTDDATSATASLEARFSRMNSMASCTCPEGESGVSWTASMNSSITPTIQKHTSSKVPQHDRSWIDW